jgi:hypothetical protein
LNKGNKNKTVLQYLKENQEQFNVYNQWVPLNKVTSGLSNVPLERFVQEVNRTENSNQSEQVAISNNRKRSSEQDAGLARGR